ncbi:hypothetical protein GMMP15_1030064 [Candidatus Magnetomoraceae bacterium gMMP-15]
MLSDKQTYGGNFMKKIFRRRFDLSVIFLRLKFYVLCVSEA